MTEEVRKTSGWSRRKDTERELVRSLARAFLDLKVHPKVNTRYQVEREKRMEEMQALVERDAMEMALRNEKEMRARLLEEPLEIVPLIRLEKGEKEGLLEYFDLEDEQPLDGVKVDSAKVAQAVLDEVAETLQTEDWWRKCGNPVRRVLLEGQAQLGVTVRALSRTELLWKDFLSYQEANAWETCCRAAALAGRLLLFQWDQDKQYRGVVEKMGEAEAWMFPERLFGGLYCGDGTRKVVGQRLRSLFESHRKLVQAAVNYIRESRNRIIYYGTGKKGPSSATSTDSTILSTESRADHLILGFFPWVSASQLGVASNIHRWERFQEHLNVFVSAYKHFWDDVGVFQDEEGETRWMPPHMRTWDFVTSELCQIKQLKKLKKHLSYRDELREDLVEKEKRKRALAKEEAEAEVQAAAAVADAVSGEGEDSTLEGAGVVDGDGGDDGDDDDDDDDDDEEARAVEGEGGGSEAEDAECSGNEEVAQEACRRLTRSKAVTMASDGGCQLPDEQELGGARGGDGDGEEEDDEQEEEEPVPPEPEPPRRTTRSQLPVAQRAVKAIRRASLPLPRKAASASAPASMPQLGRAGRAARRQQVPPPKRKDPPAPFARVPSKKPRAAPSPARQRAAKKGRKRPAPATRMPLKKQRVAAPRAPEPVAKRSVATPKPAPKAASAKAAPLASTEKGGSGDGDCDSESDGDGDGDTSGAGTDLLRVRVVTEADAESATAISVVLPKQGQRFEYLESHGSLQQLLKVKDGKDKAEMVVTFRKSRSGSVYSFKHLTTAPHQTHPANRGRVIQAAAAEAGLPSLNLNGDMSVVHPDATFLAPGTKEYTVLGLDAIIGDAIKEEVLSETVRGCVEYVANA